MVLRYVTSIILSSPYPLLYFLKIIVAYLLLTSCVFKTVKDLLGIPGMRVVLPIVPLACFAVEY